MTVDSDPYAVALTVVRALDSLGVASTVGGSIAALEEQHVAGLVTRLGPEFYADEDALRRLDRDYLKRNAGVLGVATLLQARL